MFRHPVPMIDFMTEKQIENLLTAETRELVLPDGKKQIVTADRLFWIRHDLLIRAFITTSERLFELTAMNMAGKGYSFADAFKSVVTYIDNQTK